ncbi:MAG: hypothetical protein OXU24_04690 [Gammaproteobacteria bacterium]|nr:hypothetical protein [Gammaproteobacteria bacterium]
MKNIRRLVSSIAFVSLAGQLQAQDATLEATYNGEAGRIINENCVVCHREGGIGPMQFETYDQVRPWAPLIQLKVANREMPPYAYDHGIGIQDLQGDWRLAQDEIDTLVAWVNQGAPMGDPDSPLPPADLNDPDAWNFEDELGQPDVIIPSVPIDIPANGNDLWSTHYVPHGISSDRCIKAIQVKPRGEAKTVVHHANSNIDVFNDQGELERYGMLTEYAMGKWGELVPEDVCRTFPSNSMVRWSIHMYPGGIGAVAPGTIIEDNVVEIGLWLHPEGYEEQVGYTQDLKQYNIQYAREERDLRLVIPPHGYTMTQGFHSFDHPVRIDSFQPHGHLRMRAASLEIFYPETGRTEAVSQISNWSATWHHSHIYEPDVAPLLPTGAVLVLKQWYDNTEDNPNNPDPDQWVFGGSRTADEMTHAWIAVTHLDEEGYEKLVAEREEQEARSLAGSD